MAHFSYPLTTFFVRRKKNEKKIVLYDVPSPSSYQKDVSVIALHSLMASK